MKLARAHTLLITVTFTHGEILPTQHWLGMSPFAIPLGILCSLEISASHCILTVPLRQSTIPSPRPSCAFPPIAPWCRYRYSSDPRTAKNKVSHQPHCAVKLHLFHADCETGSSVYTGFVFTVFSCPLDSFLL